MQSVHITANVVCWNPGHGEMYMIQHYMIKFVSDLRQVGGLLRFPQPIKLIDITDKLLKVALSTIKQTYALGFDCEELPPTPFVLLQILFGHFECF